MSDAETTPWAYLVSIFITNFERESQCKKSSETDFNPCSSHWSQRARTEQKPSPG